MNKAHIRYLENRLVAITKECGRIKVLTKNTYQNTKLKESQIATMEEFIDNIRILIDTLGYRILTPTQSAQATTTILHCKDATGFVSASGFVVQGGSKVSDHTTPSFETQAHSFFKLRSRLIEDGIIDGQYQFVNDYEFSSPSAAAAIVLGRSANGLTEWRTEDGKKLKEL